MPSARATPSGAGFAPEATGETHISVLLFGRDLVCKFRKPVRTDFCDFSTPQLRRADCEREVDLNRRLAPDVYLGVGELRPPSAAPPSPNAGAAAPAEATAAEVEPFVLMRRLPAATQLSHLLAHEDDVDAELEQVARALARFHAEAERSPDIAADGDRAAVARQWDAALSQLAPFAGKIINEADLADIRALADRWFGGRLPLYLERAREGHVVDGHGDLRADNIFCLDDGPRILDCIEFDDHLRHVDVATDIAFLVMDLRRVGRGRDASHLLNVYEEFAGASLPRSLVELGVAYWALVRAKVACLRWTQGVDTAAAEANQLVFLALEHLRANRPRLVLIGGLPGTGKSTTADGLSAATGWTVLSSDVIRKQRAGFAPEAHHPSPLDSGLYRPDITDATYREMLALATTSLDRGESVILDASWTSAARRQLAAAVAHRTSSELIEIRCVTDPVTAKQRLTLRAVTGSGESDATDAIAEAMAARSEPWPSAKTLDTTGTRSENVERALALVR